MEKQFAKNLHARQGQLETTVQYEGHHLQLNRKIEDLEDVRHVMAIQQISVSRNGRLTPS